MMQFSNADIASRPRLDADTLHATGPGPLSPFWAAPVPPLPPAEPLRRLEQQLGACRSECCAALREAHRNGPILIGRSELDWLNASLAQIRALNATLTHDRRSAAIARWGEPVLPPGVLHGPRDLLPILTLALRALSHLIERDGRDA